MFTLFHELLHFLGKSLSVFYDLIPSYGLAIILLTVAVRLVLLPLTIKQTRSMQEMQRLQPEVKRIQAKYKGDRQKMNEEMMNLYKEHKVNPLGGCLPLLLQLPIFWALYRVFAGCGKTISKKSHTCAPGFVGVGYLPAGSALARAIEAGKAGFLGMNLGLAPIAAIKAAGKFPGSLIHGMPYFLLVLGMVATTWYQQKQISAVSTGQQAQQMQMMGKVMPLLLGVFSLNLPAGVSIYWVASNVWTIVQQQFMLKPAPAPVGAATGTAAAKPAEAPAKKGGLAALLQQGQADRAKPSGKATGTASSAKGSDGAAKRQPAKARPGPDKGPDKGLDKSRPKGGAKAVGKDQPAPAKQAPTVEASATGDADGAVSGNGEAPEGVAEKAAPARGNGRAAPPQPGRPAPSGSSSRPRNTSAKKRRRR